MEEKTKNNQKTRNHKRRKQLGSGMRGDKRRTIRMQDDKVIDHIINVKMKASDYLKGKLEKFNK